MGILESLNAVGAEAAAEFASPVERLQHLIYTFLEVAKQDDGLAGIVTILFSPLMPFKKILDVSDMSDDEVLRACEYVQGVLYYVAAGEAPE